MPTNVEIKARIRNWTQIQTLVAELADGPPEILNHYDTFFRVSRGRLKLRDLGDGRGELIHYERPDVSGPKCSHYRVYPTRDPESLCALLGGALGVVGTVQKTRRLYWYGPTRIHLDEVAGLSHFLELEVVLRAGQSASEGKRLADELLTRLEIAQDDLVAGAYLDLLLARQQTEQSNEK